MRAVVRWPVREGLLAYLERMREILLEDYRWRELSYWVRVPSLKQPGKPPKVPPLLKEK